MAFLISRLEELLMLRTIVIYGLTGAVVVGVLMAGGSLVWMQEGQPPSESGAVVGYLIQLLALTAVFLGVKHHRDVELGGVIRFLPAFGIGTAINAVATLGWVIGWEIVLAVSDMDFPAVMKEQMLSQARARGASDVELNKAVADAAKFARLYGIAPVRWAISFVEMFPIGVVVSLVAAGLLRNSRFMPAREVAR
jgi:hypothetical protein